MAFVVYKIDPVYQTIPLISKSRNVGFAFGTFTYLGQVGRPGGGGRLPLSLRILNASKSEGLIK